MYQLLGVRRLRQPRLFKKLRVIQIDEWAGLDARHPASCAADLRRNLVEPLGLAPRQFTGFESSAPDLARECERISRWLEQNGPIDICVLGLGLNGHIAMNEPAAIFVPGAHPVRLAASSRRHGMLKGLKKKPRYGLTLGLADILASKQAMLLASGQKKRSALRRLLRPTITTRFPASFLWLHPGALVLCDRAACPA